MQQTLNNNTWIGYLRKDLNQSHIVDEVSCWRHLTYQHLRCACAKARPIQFKCCRAVTPPVVETPFLSQLCLTLYIFFYREEIPRLLYLKYLYIQFNSCDGRDWSVCEGKPFTDGWFFYVLKLNTTDCLIYPNLYLLLHDFLFCRSNGKCYQFVWRKWYTF